MEDMGIFIAGTIVTLLVVTALSMLLWAAVQDGRTQDAVERGLPHDLDETAEGRLAEIDGAPVAVPAPSRTARPLA